MTDAQKLEALMDYGVAHGLKPKHFAWIQEDKLALVSYWLERDNYKTVLLSHDFAKALWGEREVSGRCKCGAREIGQEHAATGRPGTTIVHAEVVTNLGWQYHLQQMAIAEDPIDYMHKAVFGHN